MPRPRAAFFARRVSPAPCSIPASCRCIIFAGSPMAPGQAAGRLAFIDERADVFSLGAILCILLTGRPPYVHADVYEVVEQAQRGELSEALARIDRSGADVDLITLCKQCLAVDR